MVDQPSPQSEPKRGRGRPRKYPLGLNTEPKRGRGRPRKYPLPDEILASATAPAAMAAPAVPAVQTMPPEPAYSSLPLVSLEPVVLPAKSPRGSRRTRAAIRAVTQRITLRTVVLGVGGLLLVALSIVALAATHQSISWFGHGVTARPASTALAQLAKLTDLPKGESPDVYIVRDAGSVTQPFLKDAQNGDQVFLYRQAGKAIVYRPSNKTIVAVGPIAARTLAAVTSIGLYNGTPLAGLTSREEATITQKFSQTSVAIKEKAARQDYPNTIVIDVTGLHPDVAKALAANYHATIVTAPAGETVPQVDVLIIFGADAE